MDKISVIILTKSEENNILDCLENILGYDEIIIVDDYSQDRTIELVKRLNKKNIKIYQRSLGSDFSKQRDFGLSKAKNDWVLFIDADERIPAPLKNEIMYLTRGDDHIPQFNGYYLRRVDFMWGKELRHGETGNIKHLRLAKKDLGKWEGRVHEEWKIRGRIGELKNPILHYPHQTVREFLADINKYTSIRAKTLYRTGIQAYLWQVVAYPAGKFILNYFVRLGFLDGLPGFVFAVTMSFHSFLVRGKLWLLWKRS